jgi:hypothetical protein
MNRNIVTRAKAQSIIANTTDPEVIRSLLKHENGHVRKYAEHKLAKLAREVELASEEHARLERERKDRKNARDRARRAEKKAKLAEAGKTEAA